MILIGNSVVGWRYEINTELVLLGIAFGISFCFSHLIAEQKSRTWIVLGVIATAASPTVYFVFLKLSTGEPELVEIITFFATVGGVLALALGIAKGMMSWFMK